MIIENHSINLSAAHSQKQHYSMSESLFTQSRSVGSSPSRPNDANSPSPNEGIQSRDIDIALRDATVEAVESEIAEESTPSPTDNNGDLTQLDIATYNLKMLLEQFTGKEIKLSKDLSPNSQQDEQAAQQRPTRVDTLMYQRVERYYEFESSMFNASGQIEFSDGNFVEFDFSAYAERSFYSQNTLEIQMGSVEVIDPLVVNLKTNALDLTQERVKFDLNDNGKEDDIYFATGTSGFLAIDKNNNGVIDDGSEVIGALSGNGFKELQSYDLDNNQFIDDADPIFGRLRFFQKDDQGKDNLNTLASVGIGALYLGSIDTPFEVKDSANQAKALVRSSGVFLYEDKSAGQLQQIDLVI